jgi:hypothetical protein
VNGQDFQPECVDELPANAPLIYVWGDSHAASLFVGLREMQKQYRFRLAQFTQSKCAPVINSPNCPKNNYSENIQRITKLKPDFVILDANWYESGSNINHTIKNLKELKIKKIIIVGQAPIFTNELANLITHEYRRNYFKVPNRLFPNKGAWEADDKIKSIALTEKVEFLSIKEIMCNPDGCLVVVNQSELASFVGSHISPPVAKIIAEEILNKYVGIPSANK